MPRKRMLVLGCIGFVILISIVGIGTGASSGFAPALSAANACHSLMTRTEGYFPWRLQGSRFSANGSVFTYSDGYNTAYCQPYQLGPLWVVTGLGQTEVGCSLGLTATGNQECPRKAYGVIP